jgi:hypothetical protein
MPAPLNTRKQKITVDPRRQGGGFGRGRKPKHGPDPNPFRHQGRWRQPGEPDERPPDEPVQPPAE